MVILVILQDQKQQSLITELQVMVLVIYVFMLMVLVIITQFQVVMKDFASQQMEMLFLQIKIVVI